MIDAPWVGYLLAFVVAAAVALVLTPLAIRAAVRFGLLDEPSDRKAHEVATPYLGGLAMVVGFTLAVGVAAVLVPGVAGVIPDLGLVLGLGVLLAALGLVDDLRGVGVGLRLGAQVAVALALWAGDNRIGVTSVEWLDLILTLVWVVGITNAMNLLDNMDGLSAGIATIAALWFGLIGALNGQVLVASLSFGLAGCALGFLRHNRPPARIYMGDAGSLFLGMMLATVGIRLDLPVHPVSAALIPILVLTVPVLDTTLVVAARLRHGISPFQGGRDHTSHRLVQVGLPVPVAVMLIAIAGLAHGWVALLVTRVDTVTAVLLAGLVFALDAVLFALLARVPVYDNSRGPDLVIGPRSAHADDGQEPPR